MTWHVPAYSTCKFVYLEYTTNKEKNERGKKAGEGKKMKKQDDKEVEGNDERKEDKKTSEEKDYVVVTRNISL